MIYVCILVICDTFLSILRLLLLWHSHCFGTGQFQSNSEVVSCFPWFLLSSMFLVRPGKAGVPKRSVILSPLKKAPKPFDNVLFWIHVPVSWVISGDFCCAFVVFCGFNFFRFVLSVFFFFSLVRFSWSRKTLGLCC